MSLYGDVMLKLSRSIKNKNNIFWVIFGEIRGGKYFYIKQKVASVLKIVCILRAVGVDQHFLCREP